MPKLHYVDAPGGSGKTYVFNKLSSHLRHHNMKVACAGIATTLMIDGCTVHGLFKLPVPVVENSTCKVPPTSEHAELLRAIDLIIVDEASMIPTHSEFAAWLLQLGNGELNDTSVQPETIEIPPECVCDGDLIDEVFSTSDHSNLQDRVILSPKNEHCLQVNERVLGTLPGEVRTYISADSVKCDNEEERQNYPTEFLNSLTPSGMPPHRLNLKVNAVVMLLRNLSLRQGLCNGTRLRVTHLHSNCIQATILTGASHGNTVLIPRIKLAPSDTNLPFMLERHQLPLQLAYSMTINKAQSQTFEKVGIYLPSPVFSHGQLYVAFSRARSLASVKVKVVETQQQGRRGGRTVTPNVVYREVLSFSHSLLQ